jgi:hypothetical protein
LLVGFLAVAASIGLSTPAFAQRESFRPGSETRGIVKTIDATSITIVIPAGREAPPTEKSYAIAKEVEVCVGGGGGLRFGGIFKEAKVADVSPDLTVGLSLSADGKTVTSIVAEEPVVRGILKSVDAKKNTLSVTVAAGREASDEVKSFTVAADAEIAIDDGRGRRVSIREGKLDELTEGAVVSLRLSLDKKQVHGVHAEGSTLGGVLKALNVEKRQMTLTLRPSRGEDAAEERTVAIAKEAVILLDDGRGRRLSLKEVKLDAVPVGCNVTVKLAVDQSFVMMLRAEGPALFGLLKGVDADKGTITIAIQKGRDDAEERTLTLTKDARVTFDGKDSKLADLKPGENGPLINLRLTLDQKMVQVVSAHEPRPRE